jgi:AAA15 family ATPase/GTPase
MSKIIVIGSGFAGISAATLLASNGHEVYVLEKNKETGGRARQLKTENGYVFDMGPSWYWMPDVFEKYFSLFGYSTAELFDLRKLNPGFEVRVTNFVKTIAGFGLSSVSEIVCYAFPELNLVFYNRRDREAVAMLGINLELKRGDTLGEIFIKYNNKIREEILNAYPPDKTNIHPINLQIDQFFSWLYQKKSGLSELHVEVCDILLSKKESSYPELKFTIRDKNDSDKIKEGFLFEQKGDTILFSLWHGTDNLSGNPYITLSVNSKNILKVELIATNSQARKTFFGNVAAVCKEFTPNSKMDSWSKVYKDKDLKKTFNTFFDDYKTIDILLDYELKGSNPKDVDGLRKIEDKDFNDTLAIIRPVLDEKDEEVIEENISNEKVYEQKPFYLSSVSLKNIGHFQEIELDLSKRVTVLIGENGSGKSTILRAIALGLSLDLSERTLLQDWLKINKTDDRGNKEFAADGEIIVAYEFKDEIQTDFIKNKISFKNTINQGVGFGLSLLKMDGDFTIINKKDSSKYYEALLDLILTFPQGVKRTSPQEYNNLTYPNINDIRPLIWGYKPLYEKSLIDWIVAKSTDKNKNVEEIGTIFSLISHFLKEDVSESFGMKFINAFLREDGSKEVIVAVSDAPDGISLDLLSQGYNNLFMFCGTIVQRLYQMLEIRKLENYLSCFIRPTNKPFKGVKSYYAETIKDLHGLVLIDEIDTFLHPQWQRNILKVLVDEFPKLQLVVTTHSPLVITGIPNDISNVFWIRPTKQPISFKLYGNEVSTVLLKAFALNSLRDSGVQQKIDELFILLETEQLVKAEELLKELKEKIDEDPDILRAETILFGLKD